MADLYVGEYLAEDIDAFCSTWRDATYFSTKFRGMKNGYSKFHLPIFFFGGTWFAYKGMIGRAVILDLIKWTIPIVVNLACVLLKAGQAFEWADIICELAYQVVLAFTGMDVYWKYVTGCLESRGLKSRSAVQCPELAESLARDGNSLKRAILYHIFFVLLTKTCITKIWLTVYWGWLV